MVQPRVLVVVLAGGVGSRLELLTRDRAKPALPYAGHFRLIDVALSNCLHSGLSDVWVIEQNNPVSLMDHLSNGRPWDLDRTTGGLLPLHPRRGSEREGWHNGTADALWKNADLLREFGADALVVVSADAVYRLDYESVVQEHLASGCVVTMVTTRVAEDAGRYGVVRVDDGRVTDYAYKPDDPATDLVCNEVFVFDPGPTLDLLEELGDACGEGGLEDLGDDLLPRLVEQGRAREHRLETYWRDLGTIEAYWSAHMDLVADAPPYDPGQRDWPLVTKAGDRPPARIGAGAEVRSSLLAPGSTVGGRVERSVLSPGVVVEEGATVVESVLLDDVVVRSGAVVRRAVLDRDVEVEQDACVGGDTGVAVVGGGERIEKDAPVAPDGRRPDDEDDEDDD